MALAYYALSPEMITDLSALFIADSQFYRAYWNQQQVIYRDCWNYFTGIILQNTMASQANDLEWPLRVNLVEQAVLLHAYFLWGVKQEGSQIIDYLVQPKRTKTKEGKALDAPKERAQRLQETLNQWFRTSHATSLLLEQGRLFNMYGGAFLKAVPDPNAPSKISLTATPAEYCYPVWDPTDYRRLLRMHVARRIPVEAAEQQFGYVPGASHQDVLVDYIEHWEPGKYSVEIGVGASRQTAKTKVNGKWQDLAGGFKCTHPVTGQSRLPWVYIPRLRTGRFYGKPLPTSIFGIQDEYNTRLADTGDAISQITHPTRYGHDIAGPQDEKILIPSGPEVFNAGRTMPGMEPPEIKDLAQPQLTTGVLQFQSDLLDLSRYVSHISPVVVGLDEGSQRSGETLNIRAIPTTATIQDYRMAWEEGFSDLAEIFLMLSYGLEENGIEEADFDHEIATQWQPILPKDRSANVEEQVTLVGSGLRSKKLAVTKLGDVPNVDDELAQIDKDLAEAAKRQQAQQPDKKEELRMNQEAHKQKLGQMQEMHEMKMSQAKERVKVNAARPRTGQSTR